MASDLARQVSDRQWNEYRSTIIRLYIDEDKRLEEVRRILQDRHNFSASAQRFKKRLAAWKIRKNLSEEYRFKIQEHMRHTSRSINLTFNGKPLTKSRLRRSMRSQKPRLNFDATHSSPRICVADGPISISCVKENELPDEDVDRCCRHNGGLLEFRALQQSSSVDGTVELVLANARSLFQWYVNEDKGPKIFTYIVALDNVFSLYQQGLNRLDDDSDFATYLFSMAGAAIPRLLKLMPFQLLGEIVLLLESPKWLKFPLYKAAAVGLLVRQAFHDLGIRHPVFVTLDALSRTKEAIPHLSRKLIQLTMDIAGSRIARSARDCLLYQISLSNYYSYCGDYEIADTICSRAVDAAELLLGQHDSIPAQAISLLAFIKYQRADFEHCKALNWRVIQLTDAQTSKQSQQLQLCSYHCLAKVAETQFGDGDAATHLWLLALQKSARLPDKSISEAAIALRYLKHVERLLREQGRNDERRQLLADYGHLRNITIPTNGADDLTVPSLLSSNVHESLAVVQREL